MKHDMKCCETDGKRSREIARIDSWMYMFFRLTLEALCGAMHLSQPLGWIANYISGTVIDQKLSLRLKSIP